MVQKNKNFKFYSDNLDFDELKTNLTLSKELMTDEALIFISIGEDNVCEIKLLCDEVFEKANKLAMFSIKTANQTENMNIIKNTEFMLVYRKTSSANFNLPSKIQEARCTVGKESQTINNIIIPKGIRVNGVEEGIYTDHDILKTGGNEDMTLVDGLISVKNGYLEEPIVLGGRWSCPNDVRKWIKKFTSKSTKPIYNKFGKELVELYLNGPRFQPRMIKYGFEKPETFLPYFTSKGKNQLKEILGENSFTYPKDIELIKYILSIASSKKDATVLDFYAGSGTTMQAVVEHNEENDKNYKTILISNNENNSAYDILIPRLTTIKSGVRKDGSKYSDGMNFTFEVKYI